MVIIIGFNYSRPAQVAENLKIKPCRADKWNSAESGIFCRWWTSGTPARGLGHMRGLKLMFALAGLLFLIRYVVVCYHTSEFNHFVTLEAQRTRQKGQLKGALLNRA